jgi:Relaxase/Mobilisation nuclease domain
MTNHFSFCRSFGEPMGYCLQDKRQRQGLSEEEDGEHRQTANRAEVLYYNQCYGDEQELIRQYREVQKLDYNMVKPAFHLSLNLPPGEKIKKSQFVEIAKDCAKALDFERHQYVVIRHKDTAHPHIHLVVNRIGADGHVMEDSHILPRVHRFCREAEQKYELTRVQSIRRYRVPEERNEPSRYQRIIKLKAEITQTLKQAQDLASFTAEMQERGYKVYKTERGISFKDEDGVLTKGSGADYPWKKIEATLAENLTLRLIQKQRLEQEQSRQEELKLKQALKQKLELEEEPEHRLVQRRGLRMSM